MRLVLADLELDIPADHHAAQLLGSGIANVDSADALSLAKHGAAVCDLHNLIQFMRNKEDGFSFLCE